MPIRTEYSHHLPEATLAAARAAIVARVDDTGALKRIADADAALPASPGKWSRKEILGHLADSALNNTQRFMRAQIPAHLTGGVLRLPGYEQDAWVRASAYQAREWREVIELWVALNRHIVHIIDNFDAASLPVPCAVGADTPAPIEHLIIDYAGHLVHHHRQITG
jgi:hypothetical protein